MLKWFCVIYTYRLFTKLDSFYGESNKMEKDEFDRWKNSDISLFPSSSLLFIKILFKLFLLRPFGLKSDLFLTPLLVVPKI